MKDNVRKYSIRAQFDMIRIALSAATGMNAVLFPVGIQGAHFQNFPIPLNIRAIPPKYLCVQREALWRFNKLPYGIKEAGSEWFMVFYDWLIQGDDLEMVSGVDQLFIKRDTNSAVKTMMAKVTYAFLCSERGQNWMHSFIF